ncbi:MAG: MBL fold metallo-hydrolase [Simkaniaceae bacterium]|nr:MBL fold metallo-hydrolase [Candidatus Sacchlamyda saccharinae]
MSAGYKLRKIYRVGYCIGRGAIAQKNLSWAKVRFYARAFLIEHPQNGLILIDTGYGRAFVEETKRGLGRIYPMLLKVVYDQKDSLQYQLEQDGITQNDLSYLILTHFHPDHIGGLTDFIDVPWIYRGKVLEKQLQQSVWKKLKSGFFQGLIPPVAENSLVLREEEFSSTWEGFLSCDVFGDGSLQLIDLPGHAFGQMGVLANDTLFAADAIWSSSSPPNKIGLLAQENSKAYKKTYQKLQTLSNSLNIIPTHTIEPL